jgi:hypothetical protein
MHNHSITRLIGATLTIFLFVASPSTASNSMDLQSELTPQDEKAIKATIEAYRVAWLANDAKGVLKIFTDEAVLLPAHGAPAVVGLGSIQKYWFASSLPATIVQD